MSAALHARAKAIFLAARQRPEVLRPAFLAAACGDDGELRAEVEALLANDHEKPLDTARLRAPVEDWTRAHDRPPPVPERIGAFRVRGVLGEGGMGIVYEAEQERPRRSVALKMMRAGVASPEALRRFEREVQILALLQHPGIAQVYEAGSHATEAGPQPYFVMELVRGQPITQWVRECDLGRRERLELFARVCDAVEHAHEHGVVHRDLKPGNVMVDDDGQPKVLDFGIARMVEDQGGIQTLATNTGMLIGTLPYMSPEQVGEDRRRVDARADVYALGVILYELLAGRLPLELLYKTLPAAVRAIQEEEPTRLRALDKSLRGDLDSIVVKAIDKDSSQRYASAGALAADVRRFLAERPIEARVPSTFYQFRKFARRNKALVGAFAAVFVTLAIGAVTTTILYLDSQRLAGVAQARLNDARQRLVRGEYEVAWYTGSFGRLLQHVDGATAARVNLMEEANATLASFRNMDPTRSSIVAGYAYQCVGEARLVAGQSGKALASFRESMAVREALLMEQPSVWAWNQLLVGAWRLAEVAGLQGHTKEALRQDERALDCLLKRAEFEVQAQEWHGNEFSAHVWRRIGSSRVVLGEFAAATEALDRSLACCAPTPGLFPGSRPVVSPWTFDYDPFFIHGALPQTLRAQAELLLAKQQPAEALPLLDEALRHIETLTSEVGVAHAWQRTQFARCQLSRVQALGALGRHEEAAAAAAAALARSRAQLALDADHFPSRHLEGAGLAALAICSRRTGDAIAADGHGEAAVAILEALAVHDPDNALVRRDLGFAWIELGRARQVLATPSAGKALAKGVGMLRELEQRDCLAAVDAALLPVLAREAEAVATARH